MKAELPAVQPAPLGRVLLDEHFHGRLAEVLGTDDPDALAAARRALYPPLADLLARPGKEVRARLVEHAFALARTTGAGALVTLAPELPLLVEMLHAGSLVIDDIEDDADMRRGAPALHRVHGVPIALNAGNWLYFWPLALLGRLPLDEQRALAVHRRTTSTLLRCHHGQAMDLGVRVHDVAQAELPAVVELATALKTGSLLELACALGAIAAHAPPHLERALATFGREVGVALQMLDDLSAIVTPSRRAKGEEDLRGGRLTWPWAWLAERTPPPAFRSLQRSAQMAGRRPERIPELHQALAGELGDADRDRARRRLTRAFETLTVVVGASPELAALARDIQTLEQGYV